MAIAPVDLATPGTVRGHQRSLLVWLFGLAGFLAASLLFALEPLAAKALLPELGGSPAVWNTAMAFFQVTLLAGYLVAHLLSTLVRRSLQRVLQMLIVAAGLLVLPFDLPSGFDPAQSPVWWELSRLAGMVGLPFLALATITPTIQKWFAATTHTRAVDPFFLYAASNLGSFGGLFAYPFLIEPRLDLVQQSRWFAWAYLGFGGVMLAAALSRQVPTPVDVERDADAISRRRRLFWILASAVPALLLMGVTRHLSTDVASFPLLWVVPLSLYLLTFVVAFGKWSTAATRLADRFFPLLAVAAAVATAGVTTALWIALTLPLLVLFVGGIASHGALYGDRPDRIRLTEFYLWISTGGALGGMFGALAAPVLFSDILEYPVAVVAAVALCRTGRRFPNRLRGVAAVIYAVALAGVFIADSFQISIQLLALAAVSAVVAGRHGIIGALLVAGIFLGATQSDATHVLLERRTFFGVYRVLSTDTTHTLISGTTVHGAQDLDPGRRDDPLSYYHRRGPIGELMAIHGTEAEVIGVVGLGTGALAAYGQQGQTMFFYEIDPAVVEIALRPELFTYLRDTDADVELVVGDGRLALDKPHPLFDLLVIDAFSSDSIPTHLLTREAVATYFEEVEADGVVALHISNRNLDLEPTVGRVAADLGLASRVQHFQPGPEETEAPPTSLVVLAREEVDLGALEHDPRWSSLRVADRVWTDTYTDLISVIRWR